MAYYDANTIHGKEIVTGFFGKYMHGEMTTTGIVEIRSGSLLPEHSHVHEQVTVVIEGELEFNLAGEIRVLSNSHVVIIPSNIRHGAKALSDCKVIDFFSPVREDYK